jgi:hypothetical protein
LREELPSKTSLTLFQLPLQTSESIYSFHHNSTTQPSEKAILLIIHNNDCKSLDNPVHTDTLRFKGSSRFWEVVAQAIIQPFEKHRIPTDAGQ